MLDRDVFPKGTKEDSVLKRALQSVVVAGIAAGMAVGVAWAAENPFIGEWKLDSSRSRTPDEMKVTSKGGNTYAFNFGSGTAENIVADGTDQPGLQGTTLSVKAEAPDTWIVVRKKDGQLLLRGTWKLSQDGSTLTDYYREFGPDGSTTMSLDYIYQRNGGGSGFAADWKSIKETRNSPPLILEVKAYQDDGLSFIIPSEQATINAKLDGKDYPSQGPNARPDSSSSRRVDDHTLEMTDKRGGSVRDTREIRLSPDGKTLTMTINGPGQREPDVLVFDRE
jgi:hypothetical protein